MMYVCSYTFRCKGVARNLLGGTKEGIWGGSPSGVQGQSPGGHGGAGDTC